MNDRNQLAAIIVATLGRTRYADINNVEELWFRRAEIIADTILADHAVIRLPAEASENTWTNDVTGAVYVSVRGRMVVLDDGELLDPDEVRHYAAALLAAARKAEETR